METAVERVWAIEYVTALCEVGPSKGFGWIDRKPMRSPKPAEAAARYLSKYLAKWQPDGRLEISDTVRSAGRTLLNYTSRKLTGKTGCTMRALRNVRVGLARGTRELDLGRVLGSGAAGIARGHRRRGPTTRSAGQPGRIGSRSTPRARRLGVSVRAAAITPPAATTRTAMLAWKLPVRSRAAPSPSGPSAAIT